MRSNSGFTLIELSIVLVIIGLIVGGILVGQDLIKAAEVRAQVSQIEKLNSAVNTFRGKFGGIPGDLALTTANQYGFNTGSCDGSTKGERDGNGLVQGVSGGTSQFGEPILFWNDLSSDMGGDLIEGSYPGPGAGLSPNCTLNTLLFVSNPRSNMFFGEFMPQGKIGRGTYIYLYSNNGYNWYGLATYINSTTCCAGAGTMLTPSMSIPVTQAYSIDNKVDDGQPITGVVQAVYLNFGALTYPSATNDTTTSCYNTTNNAYSLSSLANYGANGNCALSFRFQ